jgi:hypothetical protein
MLLAELGELFNASRPAPAADMLASNADAYAYAYVATLAITAV